MAGPDATAASTHPAIKALGFMIFILLYYGISRHCNLNRLAGRISDPETLSKYSTYPGESLNIESTSKQYKRHTGGNRYPVALKDIFHLRFIGVYL
jgi:hypothetical protein